MTAKVIGSGKWETNSGGILMTTVFPTIEASSALHLHQNMWNIGQIVDVRPRTWAGINRPGGTGRITNIHYAAQDDLRSIPTVIGLDVKYSINSGQDLLLDPELVKPHVELQSRGRRRESAIKPMIAPENCLPNSSYRESKTSKLLSKKQSQIVVKKGSASKTKLSLTRKIGFPGRRKSAQHAAEKSAAKTSSRGAHNEVVQVSNIPREIVFKTAMVLNTPNSGRSKSATRSTSLGNCSPLGEEGIESQLMTTSSYERMVQPQRPSAGTSNAHCPLSNILSGIDNMECDIIELRISPHSESDKEFPESFISATPLATGLFSKERQCSFFAERKQARVDIIETCDGECVNRSTDHTIPKNMEATAPRAHVSLRNVYDNEIKKATQFVGGVVQGCTKIEDGESNKGLPPIHENGLNQFGSLLNDFLSDSDGMIEVEDLAYNLSKFAASSSNVSFDYTDHDVETFLSELCSQNKIMRTEGWIYNI